MTNGREYDKQALYQIKVKGNLDAGWSEWFEGFRIVPEGSDETVLVGNVMDQAALHSLLARIRDLGLPLLSVQRMETEE